jgi:hypothetical protein
MSETLRSVLDWLAWLAALAAIFGYVLSFLRNRPYVRPFSSLGLLLTGAALLAAPPIIDAVAQSGRATPIVYALILLVGAVVFQLIAALRRRKPRAAEARPAQPNSGGSHADAGAAG